MQIESPGLMTGIAGIGYAFLRHAAPQMVPSVLMLDAPIQIFAVENRGREI
jgi:lantibiotic modifying enzyme